MMESSESMLILRRMAVPDALPVSCMSYTVSIMKGLLDGPINCSTPVVDPDHYKLISSLTRALLTV